MFSLYSDTVDKDVELAEKAREEKLFIGGHWLGGSEWYEVTDKISGKVIALVPMCDDELLEMAVLAARDSSRALATIRPEKRAAGLRAWADAITAHADELAATLNQEAAIPISWATAEVNQAAAVLCRAAVESERSDTETVSVPSGINTSLPTMDFSLRHPVGTVGVLLPDRHALFFAAQLAGAALATGCPVVLKASPLTPLAVTRLVALAAEAKWPPGSLNLVFGTNRELGKKLAADARVVLLALAGPAREREALGAVRAGRPFLSVGGGYGCAVLDRSAQIPQTVTRLLSLRFRCPILGRTVPYFVLTPQELTSRMQEALASGISSLKTGDLKDPSAEVPWQMSDALAQRAEDWLAAIRQAGGIIAHGGQRQGTYVEPTVVVAPAGYRRIPPPPEDAPVFVIDSYDKQPLRHLDRIPVLEQASVFTSDLNSALELAKLPDVARVDVYTTHAGQPGVGDVGQDTERLRRVMTEMTRRKWVEVHLSG